MQGNILQHDLTESASTEVREQPYNPNTKIMPTFKLPKNLKMFGTRVPVTAEAKVCANWGEKA
jgi:hypothetical protein